MKTKNFPERKNRRRKGALARALSGNRPLEASKLQDKIAVSLRDVRTKKKRGEK